MINVSNYSTLGNSGLKLMSKAMDTANTAASRVADSTNPLDIAKTAVDMYEAKAQMTIGAYLINQEKELMNASLQLLAPFGVGTNYNRTF